LINSLKRDQPDVNVKLHNQMKQHLKAYHQRLFMLPFVETIYTRQRAILISNVTGIALTFTDY